MRPPVVSRIRKTPQQNSCQQNKFNISWKGSGQNYVPIAVGLLKIVVWALYACFFLKHSYGWILPFWLGGFFTWCKWIKLLLFSILKENKDLIITYSTLYVNQKTSYRTNKPIISQLSMLEIWSNIPRTLSYWVNTRHLLLHCGLALFSSISIFRLHSHLTQNVKICLSQLLVFNKPGRNIVGFYSYCWCCLLQRVQQHRLCRFGDARS